MSSAVCDSPPSTTFNNGRAELTWEIENFLTKTDVQQSPIFSFPENSKVRFLLECSPSIDLPGKTGEFVVFNLCLDPTIPLCEARVLFSKPAVRYRITILNTKDTKNMKVFSQECYNKFVLHCDTLFSVIGGYQIKRDYFIETKNGLLNNDKLTIYCEVDDSCIKKSLAIPPNPILDDFRSLLESGKYSDAVLLIDGKSLSVHKNFLAARSVVFAAMFEHDLEEKKTNRVEISDVEVEVMELMLDFIYTGKTPELRDYASELFVAADKYQLNALKKSCEKYLIGHLKTSTVANILMMADMHQASDLKEASSVYITENVKQVMLTEGWKVLQTKSDLIDELFAKMADKQDILNEKLKTPESDIKIRKSIPKKRKKSKKLYPIIISDSELSCEASVHFLNLFYNGKLSDAFLIVGDVELPVHRNILCARSKVFADLFETQTRVQVDNISFEACKVLLRYIYTGLVDLIGYEFAHLLEASHKYQLNHLKAKCEQSLNLFSIDVSSVVEIFLLADTNEANQLKRICFDFICENIKQVIQTDGWKVLKQARPEFALELFEQVTEKKW